MIDAQIPLQGQQFQVLNPQQRISLQSLQLQLGEQQRQQKVRNDVLALNQIPGMITESGIPTDKYMIALGQIDPGLRDHAVQAKSAILEQQSQQRQRETAEATTIQKAGDEEKKRLLSVAYNLYSTTQGPEEAKLAAAQKALGDGLDDLVKSGKAAYLRWTPAQIQAARVMPSPDDMLARILPPEKALERAEEKALVPQRQGGTPSAPPSGQVPLSQVGTYQDAITGNQAPQSVDSKSGATVRGLDQTQPESREVPQTEQDDETRPLQEGEFRHGDKETAPIGVEAKKAVETPDSLREQARVAEAEAKRLRGLGTKVARDAAKEMDAQATHYRSASTALETRIQAEKDQMKLVPGAPGVLYDSEEHVFKLNGKTIDAAKVQEIADRNRAAGASNISVGNPIAVVDPKDGKTKMVQFDKRGGVIETQYQPKPDDAQNLAAGFYERMVSAEKELKEVGEAGYPGYASLAASKLGTTAHNLAMTAEQQRYRQAQENWVRANLRKESGAAIPDLEMEKEIRTYFPQPGEGPDVIAQKERARQTTIQAMSRNAASALGVKSAGEAPKAPIKQIKKAGEPAPKAIKWEDLK